MANVPEPAQEAARQTDLVLMALLALAAALRVVEWGAVGLDHFDEGAYAFSAAALAAGGLDAAWYPQVELLAPPFQYGAGALAMLLFGISDQALIGVSTLLGAGTVGLVFLAGGRWFGRPSAFAAALLLAMSDFHILYSRSGLADVSFGFFLLAALFCFAEAERKESWGWAVLTGLATGAAWNTKYHGWLALVIAAGALALGALATRTRGPSRTSLGRLGIAALVAGAAYAPWALYVTRQPGGYALLLEHHASFLRPFEAPAQAWAHVLAQLELDGWLGRSAPGLAALLLAFPAPPGQGRRRLGRAGVIGVAGIVAGQAVLVGLAALAAALGLARSASVGARLCLSFFLVFSVLTPLYVPYPRLALPWLVAAVLLAARSLVAFVRPDAGPGVGDTTLVWPCWASRMRPLVGAAALGVMVLCAVSRPPWRSASTYEPKDGFRTASEEIARQLAPGATALVWSEPAVAFYLRMRGVAAFPIVDVREAEGWAGPDPLYLITSLYATRLPGELGLRGWSAAHPGALREEGRSPVRALSNVRVLDDFGLTDDAPRQVAAGGSDYDLRLFRMIRTPGP